MLALSKSVDTEEPLKDKVGIEEDFLFNFLKRDQNFLEIQDRRWLLAQGSEFLIGTNLDGIVRFITSIRLL